MADDKEEVPEIPTTYVIADVAGRFDELIKLIEKFKKPYKLIFVGDVIDRGSQSKEVVELLMAHPEHVVLQGNHEWMAYAAKEDWLYNGGQETLKSFGGELPANVIQWMKKLPLFHIVEIDGKKFYISHAPTPDPKNPWHESPAKLWNRYSPQRNPDYDFQVWGHNSKLEWIADERGTYGVCIDDCRNKHLTALELPSLKLIHQEYPS